MLKSQCSVQKQLNVNVTFCSVFFVCLFFLNNEEEESPVSECGRVGVRVPRRELTRFIFAGTVISGIRLPGTRSRQNTGNGGWETLSTLFYSPLRKLILLIDCCPWPPPLSPGGGGGRRGAESTDGLRREGNMLAEASAGQLASQSIGVGVQWTFFLLNFLPAKRQKSRGQKSSR